VWDRIAAVDKRIPPMLQDNFKGANFWAPVYDASTNLVIDSHVYYFAAEGTYANFLSPQSVGRRSTSQSIVCDCNRALVAGSLLSLAQLSTGVLNL
jgi:hypothetical protein